MDNVRHASWCDRLDDVIGSPECSRKVGEVDSISVMIYGDSRRASVALTGELGQMVDLSLPRAARLAHLLGNADRIARSGGQLTTGCKLPDSSESVPRKDIPIQRNYRGNGGQA